MATNTTTLKVKILGCPFCGTIEDLRLSTHDGNHFIQCYAGEACGSYANLHRSNWDGVLAIWNTRDGVDRTAEAYEHAMPVDHLVSPEEEDDAETLVPGDI